MLVESAHGAKEIRRLELVFLSMYTLSIIARCNPIPRVSPGALWGSKMRDPGNEVEHDAGRRFSA